MERDGTSGEAETALPEAAEPTHTMDTATTVTSDAFARTVAPTREAVANLDLVTVARDLYADRQLLAEGGMGKVVIARDRRLGRRVAIKELRVDNVATRARFEREAMLTARLEHPGIVGVHEAGRWPSGEPFFAMRVIQGRSLDKVFQQRRDHAARLALLPTVLAVADAVAYAHEQGIIHRDLKPHNVMVGEFGETVVIDWGLAKALHDDDSGAGAQPLPLPESGDLTIHGSVIGTPMYLPPEQARGEEVDRTADVYAIGAILYELLANRRPYEGRTAKEVVAAVLEGPPPALGADIAPDLVAIVERAMARDRADRYPSARELGEDLRRFQTGQLVGAHRYTARQLLARWMRKHRAILATSAFALVVLAVLAIVGVRNIIAERAEAERQRTIAIEHRDKAEDLVAFLQTDLRKQLQTLNRLDLLEPAARKTLEYRRWLDDPSERKRLDLLGAHKHVIDALLAKTDYSGVEAALDEVVAIHDTFVAPSAKIRRDRSVFLNLRGDVKMLRGDAKGALPHYRDALAIVTELHRGEPADVQWRLDIEYGEGKLADALLETGDVKAALAAVQRAAAIVEGVTSTDKGLQLAKARAKIATRLGEVSALAGDSKAAIAELVRARQLAADVVAEETHWTAQRDLGLVSERLARVRSASGDDAGALADLREALAVTQRLHDADPNNGIVLRDLVVLDNRLAALLTRTGDPASAREHATSALGLAERIAAKDPGNAKATSDVAAALDKLTPIETTLGDTDRALELARRSVALRQGLVDRDPNHHQWRAQLVTSHYRLARVLLARGDLAAANTMAKLALAGARTVVDSAPTDRAAKRDLSVMHDLLGQILTKQRHFAGALAEYRADLAIAEELATADPSNQKWQIDLAESHGHVATTLAALGNRDEARRSFATALAILDKAGAGKDKIATRLRAARDRCCK
jgi:tetratricopeptide (TPR) repeat protein/tRNA A-37 threonylcarbamoyl transferase component Bud32